MSETCPGCGAELREDHDSYRRFACMTSEFDEVQSIGFRYELSMSEDCLRRQIAQRDERIKWLEAAYGSSPSEVCRTHHVQNCHYCNDLGCGDNTSEAARRIAALEARIKELEAERVRLLDNKFTFCAYCGAGFVNTEDADAGQQVGDHIATCPEHPMRVPERERDQLRADLVTVVPVVRAAMWYANAEAQRNDAEAVMAMGQIYDCVRDLPAAVLERMGVDRG